MDGRYYAIRYDKKCVHRKLELTLMIKNKGEPVELVWECATGTTKCANWKEQYVGSANPK